MPVRPVPERVRAGGAAAAKRWRDHFGVWAALTGAVVVVDVVAAPAPLSLADPAARLRLASMGASAVLVVLLLWRASGDEPRAAAVGGNAAKVGAPAVSAATFVAALFGVLAVALSRALWRATIAAGPAAALGALSALAMLVLAERVVRRPGDHRAGWGLALVAGAAAGGTLAGPTLGWPLGALVVARALRRRERWAALAVAIFAISLVLGLAVGARGPGAISVAALARHLVHLSATELVRAAAELADQVGVLGLLAAAAGLSRLRRTSLIFTLWSLAAGLVLRAALGTTSEGEGAIGMIVAVSSLALPLAAGMLRLAERLGRAALPAVAVIGVIVAIWPLLAR